MEKGWTLCNLAFSLPWKTYWHAAAQHNFTDYCAENMTASILHKGYWQECDLRRPSLETSEHLKGSLHGLPCTFGHRLSR